MPPVRIVLAVLIFVSGLSAVLMISPGTLVRKSIHVQTETFQVELYVRHGGLFAHHRDSRRAEGDLRLGPETIIEGRSADVSLDVSGEFINYLLDDIVVARFDISTRQLESTVQLFNLQADQFPHSSESTERPRL